MSWVWVVLGFKAHPFLLCWFGKVRREKRGVVVVVEVLVWVFWDLHLLFAFWPFWWAFSLSTGILEREREVRTGCEVNTE